MYCRPCPPVCTPARTSLSFAPTCRADRPAPATNWSTAAIAAACGPATGFTGDRWADEAVGEISAKAAPATSATPARIAVLRLTLVLPSIAPVGRVPGGFGYTAGGRAGSGQRRGRAVPGVGHQGSPPARRGLGVAGSQMDGACTFA